METMLFVDSRPEPLSGTHHVYEDAEIWELVETFDEAYDRFIPLDEEPARGYLTAEEFAALIEA